MFHYDLTHLPDFVARIAKVFRPGADDGAMNLEDAIAAGQRQIGIFGVTVQPVELSVGAQHLVSFEIPTPP